MAFAGRQSGDLFLSDKEQIPRVIKDAGSLFVTSRLRDSSGIQTAVFS
jgi:hypothetical protein